MDQSVLYWPFWVAQTLTTVWYWIVNFPHFSYFLAYDLTEFMWFHAFWRNPKGAFLWMLSRVHKWPPMVLNSLLGERTIQHTLVHQLSGKNEVFHGLLSPIIILTRVGINYLDQNGRAGFLRWWQNSTQLQGKSINVKKKQTRLNFMLNCNKINGFFILHRSGRKKLCSANMTSWSWFQNERRYKRDKSL